jgi:hypothetical protein
MLLYLIPECFWLLNDRVKVHADLVKHGHGRTAAGTEYAAARMLKRANKVQAFNAWYQIFTQFRGRPVGTKLV